MPRAGPAVAVDDIAAGIRRVAGGRDSPARRAAAIAASSRSGAIAGAVAVAEHDVGRRSPPLGAARGGIEWQSSRIAAPNRLARAARAPSSSARMIGPVDRRRSAAPARRGGCRSRQIAPAPVIRDGIRPSRRGCAPTGAMLRRRQRRRDQRRVDLALVAVEVDLGARRAGDEGGRAGRGRRARPAGRPAGPRASRASRAAAARRRSSSGR